MARKRIVILGSTGSVGCSAVKVAERLRDEIEVVGLAARNNVETLAAQAALLGCRNVVTSKPEAAEKLRSLVPCSCEVASGDEALVRLVTMDGVDTILCAIVGTGGLLPVLAAIRAGKDIAIASKEILVMAGEIVMAAAADAGVRLLPVDSEHSAIFQCLEGRRSDDVSRLILTASGGPFRGMPRDKVEKASLEDALAHPTWNMGPKVTIDSASMMNKALELVEARWLFGMPGSKLDVLIHPQSVVHSMVEFADGSLLAQLSAPDMRFPIQYALTWPRKLPGGLPLLDFKRFSQLSFESPDRGLFPSIDFAFAAMEAGGTMPAVMNAANEAAVELFMARRIDFGGIWSCIRKAMEAHRLISHPALEEIIAADAWARNFVSPPVTR